MTGKATHLIPIATLLLVPGAAALADCPHVSMTFPQASYALGGSAPIDPQLAFTVNRDNNAPCEYFVTWSYGGASSAGSRRLANGASTYPFQIYKDQSPQLTLALRDEPDASSPDHVIAGVFQAGPGPSSNTHSYRVSLRLPPGETRHPANVRFGTYSDLFVAKLWEGSVTGGKRDLLAQVGVTFTYTVPRMVDLSLVPTGQPFDPGAISHALDFGVLQTGAARAFDVVLMHNAGYSLRFSSANDGALKHASLPNKVPYSMTVAGVPIALSGSAAMPVVVAAGVGASSPAGTRLPVVATIGSLASAVAGRYSDTVTLTVTSVE